MSRFYGSMNSDKKSAEVTKPGHKYINAHIRGWDFGVRVILGLDKDGVERATICLTGGSMASFKEVPIGDFTIKNLEDTIQVLTFPKKKEG